jgi:lipopolysaccharide transport system permease protein
MVALVEFFQKQPVVYAWDLLRTLVVRDMKLRYKGSVLGIAWSLLNPLSQLLVFSLVFRFVLPLNIPKYTAFLFSGLLVWNWFQTSLYAAATAIVDGRSLIKRPGFPAALLPIVTVAANMLHFVLALPVLLFFLALSGFSCTPAWLLVPLLIALQFTFTLGLAYLVATLHVTFRDTQYLLGVFLLLFFYSTPIFYDAATIPAHLQPLYRLNPLLHLLEAYRLVLLQGTLPSLGALLGLGVISAALLCAGYQVFMRTSYMFVEEL